MINSISYFVFKDKTVFIPFKYLYQECFVLIEGEPQLYPLICFKDNSCHRNSNCAERMAKRVHYFFNKVEPKAELIIAYYKYQDKPNSIRAGLFDKELNEPRLITCNRSAFDKYKRESIIYKWEPTAEFMLLSNSKIVTVDRLLRGND